MQSQSQILGSKSRDTVFVNGFLYLEENIRLQSNIFLFDFIETYFLLVKTCLHWLSQKGQIERKTQRLRSMFLFRKKHQLKCFFFVCLLTLPTLENLVFQRITEFDSGHNQQKMSRKRGERGRGWRAGSLLGIWGLKLMTVKCIQLTGSKEAS